MPVIVSRSTGLSRRRAVGRAGSIGAHHSVSTVKRVAGRVAHPARAALLLPKRIDHAAHIGIAGPGHLQPPLGQEQQRREAVVNDARH